MPLLLCNPDALPTLTRTFGNFPLAARSGKSDTVCGFCTGALLTNSTPPRLEMRNVGITKFRPPQTFWMAFSPTLRGTALFVLMSMSHLLAWSAISTCRSRSFTSAFTFSRSSLALAMSVCRSLLLQASVQVPAMDISKQTSNSIWPSLPSTKVSLNFCHTPGCSRLKLSLVLPMQSCANALFSFITSISSSSSTFLMEKLNPAPSFHTGFKLFMMVGVLCSS
mmetsp:Transcript_60104/g.167700  ORF Transcript_60104/g.167700 Transcript_60104/m.167700 type:complete len:223 (-) Transcript_60104:2560-3228(-)